MRRESWFGFGLRVLVQQLDELVEARLQLTSARTEDRARTQREEFRERKRQQLCVSGAKPKDRTK
jgi:hypothetical protein